MMKGAEGGGRGRLRRGEDRRVLLGVLASAGAGCYLLVEGKRVVFDDAAASVSEDTERGSRCSRCRLPT